MRLIAPDRPWDDSAILLRNDGTTVLNVNDCHLDEATLGAPRRASTSIDLAFLTFTGASQYPGCFDFPLASKIERALYSKHSHLEEFVNWARLLRTKRAVPAAGNHALLAEDQLFLNTPIYAQHAGRRGRRAARRRARDRRAADEPGRHLDAGAAGTCACARRPTGAAAWRASRS